MKDKRKIGFSYAWNGVKTVFKEERNFRIHTFVAIIVICISFFLHLTMTEWGIILTTICLVFVAEMINTVVEQLIDYFKPDIHPMAKKIKDTAAGIVLVTAIFSVIIGFVIFGPKLVHIFL